MRIFEICIPQCEHIPCISIVGCHGWPFWTRPPLTTCTRHGCCFTACINLNIIYLHCYAFFLHPYKFRVHPHSGLTVQYTRKLALMVSFFTLTTRGHLLYFVFYLCPLGTHFLIFVGVCHHQRLNLFKHLLLAPSRGIYIALTHSKKTNKFFWFVYSHFPSQTTRQYYR